MEAGFIIHFIVVQLLCIGRVQASGEPSARIVGGSVAGAGQFPWMAMLLEDGESICGGSIIDEWHILTAAHCVDKTDGLEVIVGKHEFDSSQSYPGEQRVRVVKVVWHAQYNNKELDNDIALLRLQKALTFDARVSSISLAEATSSLPPTGTVAGWGRTDCSARTSPKELKMLTTSVYSREACLSMAGDGSCPNNLSADLADKVLCMVNTDNDGNEFCSGDSGGPLFSQAQGGNQYLQWGIVSWSYGTKETPCLARRNYPMVFTLVPDFLTWIEEAKVDLAETGCGTSVTSRSSTRSGTLTCSIGSASLGSRPAGTDYGTSVTSRSSTGSGTLTCSIGSASLGSRPDTLLVLLALFAPSCLLLKLTA